MSKQKPLDRITRPRDDAKIMDRNQARVQLGGISYSSIVRLQDKGKLTPIRLDKDADRTKVFYKVEQVRALTKRGAPTISEAEQALLTNVQKLNDRIDRLPPVEAFRSASKEDQARLLREATPEDRAVWGVEASASL